MDGAKFVIAGGGMVAGYAAKQLVELGMRPGDLAILSADNSVPYERPPLSKSFLAGRDTEESVRINSTEFYAEHGIDVRLGCLIDSVDVKRKRLRLTSGIEFAFEKLILATGAFPNRLSIPGAELAGVEYLRSLDDSKAIRRLAEVAKRAVVIGGGFIGMEVASVLAQQHIETTMAMPEDRVWKKFFTPEMSQFFEGYFAERGVKFLKGAKVTGFKGTRAVEAAELGDGRSFDCELVVAGIGARPAVEFLKSSGIEIDNGVVVNEYLESSAADVLAAGDIANYPDVIFGKRRRVEHWDNAVSQGQHCARRLMGERAPFKHVPYFFSDVFDLSYEMWGDPEGADQVSYRGDVTTKSFSVWWTRGGVLRAAFAMNRLDEEREGAPKWIQAGAAPGF